MVNDMSQAPGLSLVNHPGGSMPLAPGQRPVFGSARYRGPPGLARQSGRCSRRRIRRIDLRTLRCEPTKPARHDDPIAVRSHVASYGSGDRHIGPVQGDGLKVRPGWGWDCQINPGGLAGRRPWRQVDEPLAGMDPEDSALEGFPASFLDGLEPGDDAPRPEIPDTDHGAGSAVTGRSG